MTDDDDKKKPKQKDEVFDKSKTAPLLPQTLDGPLPVYKPPAKSGATPTIPPATAPPAPDPAPPVPGQPPVSGTLSGQRRPPTQPPPLPAQAYSRPYQSPPQSQPQVPTTIPQDRSEMVTPVGGSPIPDLTATPPGGTPIADWGAPPQSQPTPYPPPYDSSGWQTSQSQSRPVEEPLLPASYSENDLRSAVGVAPLTESKATRKPPEPAAFDDDDDLDEDDDDKRGKKGGRTLIFVSVFSVMLGLTIAALVFFGRSNSERYVIACEAQQIVPQQGRTFPPWGESALSGAQWKPVAIPPEAECEPLDTENLDEMTVAFRSRLVDRAEDMLTKGEGAKVDEAAAMLEQALMHARDPRFKDARKYIQRVLGDVTYWRASAKLKEAATLLTEATKQFEAANASQPRIVTDADAWAKFVKALAAKLEAGPSGAKVVAFPPTPPPGEAREPAPPGVALPVEPAPSAGSGTGSAPAPTPDAGIPSGGVLL